MDGGDSVGVPAPQRQSALIEHRLFEPAGSGRAVEDSYGSSPSMGILGRGPSIFSRLYGERTGADAR